MPLFAPTASTLAQAGKKVDKAASEKGALESPEAAFAKVKATAKAQAVRDCIKTAKKQAAGPQDMAAAVQACVGAGPPDGGVTATVDFKGCPVDPPVYAFDAAVRTVHSGSFQVGTPLDIAIETRNLASMPTPWLVTNWQPDTLLHLIRCSDNICKSGDIIAINDDGGAQRFPVAQRRLNTSAPEAQPKWLSCHGDGHRVEPLPLRRQ